jgi:hypothetical protein
MPLGRPFRGQARRPEPSPLTPPPRQTIRLDFLLRAFDSVTDLLYDPRRRSANPLLLNYFSALGGAAQLRDRALEVRAPPRCPPQGALPRRPPRSWRGRRWPPPRAPRRCLAATVFSRTSMLISVIFFQRKGPAEQSQTAVRSRRPAPCPGPQQPLPDAVRGPRRLSAGHR